MAARRLKYIHVALRGCHGLVPARRDKPCSGTDCPTACPDELRSSGGALRLIAGLVLSAFVIASGCSREPSAADRQVVRLGGQRFELEIAASPAARYQGLSDRTQIASDGGMLFVFPDVRPRSFVMRRCLAPIDLIYLSPTGRIVSMHRMQVEPAGTPEQHLTAYPSGWPAQFAVEVRGGSIDQLSLEVGEKVDLPLDQLKALAR